MLINEVENIVGLSKKSIRYYEENGLIKPKRNVDNDYRIYDEEDIRKLKVIKFLRELGVPIRELQMLNNQKMTLEECIEDRIKKIEDQEENYHKVKDMCEDIVRQNSSYEEIDIDKYFQEMRILNKEGFTMQEKGQNKKKKILGAVISSLIFSLLFLFLIGIITYFQVTEEDKMPVILYAFFVFVMVLPILGVVYNLIIRIKEIRKGEEDEASKY